MFIFYKDGKEVNRIVESPKTTFEHDIKAILEGKYTTNYMAAHYLEGLIKANGINSLLEMEDELVLRLSDFVKGSRELNTYGYVKLKSGAIKEAIYIFDLNAKLFPYKTNVYDSLGEAYFESKKAYIFLESWSLWSPRKGCRCCIAFGSLLFGFGCLWCLLLLDLVEVPF